MGGNNEKDMMYGELNQTVEEDEMRETEKREREIGHDKRRDRGLDVQHR